MNEIGCLHCGNSLINTPGKRAKKFCSTTCRSNFWQKNQRHKKTLAGLSPATKLYAKSFGLQLPSYDDYKKSLDECQNISDCKKLSDKVSEDTSLTGWQKRALQEGTINKSQTFDF